MSFKEDLEELLNKYSMEIGSNTPDFVLSEYMMDCYHSFNKAVNSRLTWYEKKDIVLLDPPARTSDTAETGIREACPEDRHTYYTAFLNYLFCPYCSERLHS